MELACSVRTGKILVSFFFSQVCLTYIDISRRNWTLITDVGLKKISKHKLRIAFYITRGELGSFMRMFDCYGGTLKKNKKIKHSTC